MGKRNSRARRRAPIRRPIPAARLSTAAAPDRVTDLTEHDLVVGWPVTEQARVRLARGEDMGAVRALAEVAGVRLEQEVTDAVNAGVAGDGLRAGLNGGPERFMRYMAGSDRPTPSPACWRCSTRSATHRSTSTRAPVTS